MTPQYAKSIITRTKRLSEAFKRVNGRQPNIEELGMLYSLEMSSMAAQSHYPGQRSGFAVLKETDPELFKKRSSKGGKNKKGWRKHGESKD